MNDEIKEILEDNGELMVRYKDNSFECFDTLPKNVLDYITNSQQELNEYKFPNCKTKDIKVVRANLVDMMRKNKRLEQENERLKTALEENNNVSIEKYNTLKLEKERLELRLFTIKDYKSRCEKAIEYIKPLITDKDDEQCYPISWYSKDVLLGTLQNGSENDE